MLQHHRLRCLQSIYLVRWRGVALCATCTNDTACRHKKCSTFSSVATCSPRKVLHSPMQAGAQKGCKNIQPHWCTCLQRHCSKPDHVSV